MVPSVTLEVSRASIHPGEADSLTARVNGLAGLPSGGGVVWFDAGAQIGTTAVNSAGIATLDLPSLAEGVHEFTAAFTVSGAISARSNMVAVNVSQATFTTASAASGALTIAPDSLASAFGTDLATGTAQPQSLPWPTELAGVKLRIEDSARSTFDAPLTFVSPSQVNFLVPARVAIGMAKLTLSSATGTFVSEIQVRPVVPAIFAADGSGRGVPAAMIVTAHPDGTRETRPVFTCDNGICSPAAVDLGASDDENVLVLYGTGVRNAESKRISVRIGVVNATVIYAGAQNEFAGLDQVNVAIPSALAGAGLVNLQLSADDQAANTVTLRFR